MTHFVQRIAALVLLLSLPYGAHAQMAKPLTVQDGEEANLIRLQFIDAPLNLVLEQYSAITGRTMLLAPGVTATITMRSQMRMTETEALRAIEAILAMHNVALVPLGDKLMKVVQPGSIRQEGLDIMTELPEDLSELEQSDQLLTAVIQLKHVEIAEVQPILQQMIHGYGKLQPLERTNSIMFTDTAINLRRILEVLEFMDRPIETREELFVYRINHAEAAQVAARLNEFIQDAQERSATPSRPQVAPATPTREGPPGVIRAARPDAPGAAAPAAGQTALDQAERGMIHGRVKVMADERINTLFILSRPVNTSFFERVINVLDQPIDPEIIVRVINLQFAAAEEVSAILNEFVGAASGEQRGSLRGGAAVEGQDGAGTRAQALRDVAADIARDRVQRAMVTEEATRIGQLSPNTKILSDNRTNALLLMGRRGDIAVLEDIIGQLDIMLGQVLIEAVIVEISLGKNVETGVDWLQRTLTAYNEQTAGPGGGLTIRDPVVAFGGASRPAGIVDDFAGARERLLDGIPPTSDGGLTYFLTFFDLNVDAVIRLAASSRDARILSTPVILTTDNTEARIIVGESRPVVTSTSASTVGDRQVSNYQFRDIGINLTVTPRINPQRVVVMDILQSADNVGGFEIIDNNRVPIITKREMEARIAVQSRSTIVLGGLVNTDRTMTTSKVPILGDIPLLGRLFRAESVEDTRTELLVLITPYVMTTPEEARAESARLHRHSHSSRTQWHEGWSDSEYATPIAKDDQFIWDRKQREQRRTPMMTQPGVIDREEANQLIAEIRALESGEQEEVPAPDLEVEIESETPSAPEVIPEETEQEDGAIHVIPWADPSEIHAPVPRR